MDKQSTSARSKLRVARHRAKATAQGARRIEVTVPTHDAWAIRAIAHILRKGGEKAKEVRQAISSMAPVKPAQTGVELIDFFRSSPFVGEDVVVERDRSTGRQVDLD